MWWAVSDHGAVQERDTVGDGQGVAEIVRGHHDRRALPRQLHEQGRQFFLGRHIQSREWLIE